MREIILKIRKIPKQESKVIRTSYCCSIISSVEELRKRLGKESTNINGDGYKYNFHWECILDVGIQFGIPFRIYDWKECRRINETEKIEFHIGGRNKIEAYIVKLYLKTMPISKYLKVDVEGYTKAEIYNSLFTGLLERIDY